MNQANDKLNRLIVAAADAIRSGQFAAGRDLAEQALSIAPGSIPAKFLVGVACARTGEFAKAAAMLEAVLKVEPSSFEVLTSLSTVYRDSGRLDESISTGIRAVQIKPRDPQAHNNLGLSFLAARRLDDAVSAFSNAVGIQPSFASAFYNLGKARQLEGQDGEASRCFAQAASIAPTLTNLLALGQMLLTLCDFEAATSCAQKCAEQFPDSAAAHLLLCGCFTEKGLFEEAERHLRTASQLDVNGDEALQMAARQRPLGHIEEANESLRRAIERNPRQISAYDSLMQNQKTTERDRGLVDEMRSLLAGSDLSPTESVSIHYGLGKALEDLGEYENAMRHYDEANRVTRQLKFGDVPFDKDRYCEQVGRMIDRFSAHTNDEACDSDLPILVIGVMRSGTSLVEQILSSHPEVVGAGEQLYWGRNWTRALSNDADIFKQLGNEYVEELRHYGPDAKHVTDKMPGNTMFAGLIHASLPNARLIHIRRNPVDTCLSIWATPNHMPQDGGNRKEDIVFVYRQYLRLMEAWRSVLPRDRFLEIDYEALVADPEKTIRSMVTFCGLKWSDACLKPEENKRLVNTPSAWQVRQPVYRSSVARWQRFEPWLGEFNELLGVAHPATNS